MADQVTRGMPSNIYTCNGCRKTLSSDDYPPVGDLSVGFTCPECSKHAKEIVEELDARLLQCGRDGKMTADYYTHKLTMTQLSTKYDFTEEQALDSIELCMSYITGEKRKDISYAEWVKNVELEAKAFLMPCDEGWIGSEGYPRHADFIITDEMPSDEHLIAIGKVAVAFTQLEEAISTCFTLLLGCEAELASILAESLPMKERCDALFHIFAYRFGSAEMIRSGKNIKREKKLQLLSKLFKRISKAASVRNKILHSAWSSDADEQKAHQLNWSVTRKNPGFPSSYYAVLSAEEILKDAAFINEVRHELRLFLWEHFAAWILERGRNREGGLELL